MRKKSDQLMPRAKDAIPADAIRLSEAFFRVLAAAEKTPRILEAIPQWAEDNIWVATKTLKEEENDDDTIEVRVRAAALFRIALFEELDTYVRDPNHNQLLKLSHEDWFFCDERVPIEFEDWLSMDSTPGPIKETIIARKRRPVFLLKAQFDGWFNDTFKNGLKSRKKRSGSFEIADAPLIEEMHMLILSGKAKSATEAAKQLSSSARGFGSSESKETRLRKAYYEQYPNIAPFTPNKSGA